MEVIKITPEIEKTICDLYKNGLKVKEVSNKTNISKGKIKSVLYKNKIKFNIESNIKITPEIEIEICELYIKGLTITEISKQYDVAPSTIYTHTHIKK